MLRIKYFGASYLISSLIEAVFKLSNHLSENMITPSRSQKAAKQLLGEKYSGNLISDRYSAYNWIDLENRQTCRAHLIRDFTRISQRSGKSEPIGELLLYQVYILFNWWHKIRYGTIDRSLFVKGVEPTNNAAERALRQYVIWRKINLGTQSDRGDRFIERMFTVIATCKQHGRSVLDFMTQAIKAYLGGAETPSLVTH